LGIYEDNAAEMVSSRLQPVILTFHKIVNLMSCRWRQQFRRLVILKNNYAAFLLKPSCYPQNANLKENAGLQTVIDNFILIHHCAINFGNIVTAEIGCL
jgi:hypothetical protein